nr:alpha/beta hydrolase [Chthonobacter albigriseus]
MPDGAARPRPVHLFVHGGYWRMFSKSDFSFVSRTVTAAGAIAAVMDYSLMPAVRMAVIVDQVRRAARWLQDHARSYGGDPDRITVGGHSAGAHLCTFLLDSDRGKSLRGAFLLSGVYDLAPLQSSFLAPLIGITDEEVRSFSPLARHHAAGGPVRIIHGDQETEPFHSQAAAFRSRLVAQHVDATRTILANANHMSCVLQLDDPASEAGRSLTELLRPA